MAKRSSLFGTSGPAKAAAATPEHEAVLPGLTRASPANAAAPVDVPGRRYPVAKTREGKRVVTAYLDREAKRQLDKIAFDEEVSIQELLVEGINSVFQARGLSRIA